MKRFFLFVLILASLMPVCRADDFNEKAYIGTWVYTEDIEDGGLLLEVLHLKEDHRAFFIYQTSNAEKSTYSRHIVGSWQSQSEDGIHIEIGGFLDLKGVVQLNTILRTKDAYQTTYKDFIALSSDMLSRTAEDALENVPAETGVFVPGGFWEVGIDIPAGTYSIRRAENITSQNFVIYEKKNESTGQYTRLVINTILNKNNPLIGKIVLVEGNIVFVDEGVYFDAPLTLGF